MRTVTDRLRKIPTLACAAIVSLTVFTGCEGRTTGHGDVCNLLTAIASDPKKMQYVKEWIESRLGDAQIRENIRERVSLILDEQKLHEIGGFDWPTLGIAEGSGVLEVKHDDWESDRIDSLAINLARSSINVKVSPATDQAPGLRAEDVSVDCRSGP
jgi:hypothetical protein